jgi:imidazolonepropionase-like amidohydrolase
MTIRAVEVIGRRARAWTLDACAASMLVVLLSVCPAQGGVARAAAPPPRSTFAITDVTVIDVARGRHIGHRTVLVDNGRIAAITSARDAQIPAGTTLVDGCNRFLIPGLMDMHVHLLNRSSGRPPNDWMFPLFIANGITSVREMNADVPTLTTVIHQWRRDLDDGLILAPRILAAGIAVRGSSPEIATQRVEAAAAAGADFIKVFSDVPAANWRAILETAAAHSLPVDGHVPDEVTLVEAAEAGQRTDEHLMRAFEACPTPRACWQVARAVERTGQVHVPTLILPYVEAHRPTGPLSDDPRWIYLRPDEQDRWITLLGTLTPEDIELAIERWPIMRKIAATFNRAGIRYLTGTDTPMPGVYPGFSLHEELDVLVQAGLRPIEALRAATLSPAEFLGIDDVTGSIAIGHRADLVLLDADPTRDIRNTQRIRAVAFDGRLLQRADLDALLALAASASQPPGD